MVSLLRCLGPHSCLHARQNLKQAYRLSIISALPPFSISTLTVLGDRQPTQSVMRDYNSDTCVY